MRNIKHPWQSSYKPKKRARLSPSKNCPIKPKHYFMLKDYFDEHYLIHEAKVVLVKDVRCFYVKMGFKETVVYYEDLVDKALYDMNKVPLMPVGSLELSRFVEMYEEVREQTAKDEVALAVLANL